MNALKNNSTVFGVILFLLLLVSLIWQGTSNLSGLVIGYSTITITAVSCFLFFRPQHVFTSSLLPILLIAWLAWISILPGLGWVSNNATPGLFQCSLWIMVFFLFATNNDPARLWSKFIQTLWLLALLSASYALIQSFIHHEMPCGFFASKNTGAAFLMVAALLLIGEFITHSNNNHKESQSGHYLYPIFLGASIVVLMFTMLLSLSRGVVIAFSSSLLLELILLRTQLSKKCLFVLVSFCLLALLALMLFAHPLIQHRIDLLQHEQSRSIIWQGAWHLWQQSPWYGLGIINFPRYYPAFSLPGDGSSLQYVHNDALQLLIETGIPGAVILLAISIITVLSMFNYLKRSERNIKAIACFAALCALVLHSLVDFNFYIVPMNLVLGCCLGYLYCEFRQAGSIWEYTFNPSSIARKSFYTLGMLCFLLISVQTLRLVMLDHYSQKADRALKQHDYIAAQNFNNLALKWFDDYEVHSYQADVYWQLANQPNAANKDSLIELLNKEVNLSLKANPYYARPYFQMALLQAVLKNNSLQAEEYFYKSIKNNPHFCLARITFALFLIDQHKLTQAQQLLEEGLRYPITPEYAENYLTYLSKLRSANGNEQAATRVMDRLEDLNFYSTDYSDLI